MKSRKFKEIKESRLLIEVVIKEKYDKFRRRFVKTRWELAEGVINLGSLSNPNRNIISVKFEVPTEEGFGTFIPFFKK